jgi:Na+-transporting methylmalonyl-CoA/oxaloacetate decarboxylase gamma subunit
LNWSLNITVTMVGLIIVFSSLMLLSLIISFYPKILLKQKRKPVSRSQVIFEEDETDEYETDDSEIIAVIFAAIAEEINTEPNVGYLPKIVVKKIRRINDSNPIWNTAGRLEAIKENVPEGMI